MEDKMTLWIEQRDTWGDSYEEEHTTWSLGLRDDGTVCWKKVRHLHPKRCPECGGWTSSTAGKYKICPKCGTKLLASEIIGGVAE
jgi:hypothetical protein